MLELALVPDAVLEFELVVGLLTLVRFSVLVEVLLELLLSVAVVELPLVAVVLVVVVGWIGP